MVTKYSRFLWSVITSTRIGEPSRYCCQVLNASKIDVPCHEQLHSGEGLGVKSDGINLIVGQSNGRKIAMRAYICFNNK